MSAALFYAAEIVVADKWLKSVSPMLLTFYVSLANAIFSFAFLIIRNSSNEDGALTSMTANSNLKVWGFILLLGALNCLADWSHYGALKKHASAATLATFYLLIPVFCTILKGEFPSARMLAAWFFGAITLYLISDELKSE